MTKTYLSESKNTAVKMYIKILSKVFMKWGGGQWQRTCVNVCII